MVRPRTTSPTCAGRCSHRRTERARDSRSRPSTRSSGTPGGAARSGRTGCATRTASLRPRDRLPLDRRRRRGTTEEFDWLTARRRRRRAADSAEHVRGQLQERQHDRRRARSRRHAAGIERSTATATARSSPATSSRRGASAPTAACSTATTSPAGLARTVRRRPARATARSARGRASRALTSSAKTPPAPSTRPSPTAPSTGSASRTRGSPAPCRRADPTRRRAHRPAEQTPSASASADVGGEDVSGAARSATPSCARAARRAAACVAPVGCESERTLPPAARRHRATPSRAGAARAAAHADPADSARGAPPIGAIRACCCGCGREGRRTPLACRAADRARDRMIRARADDRVAFGD